MIFLSYKKGNGSFYAEKIAQRLESWEGNCFYFERNCKTADMANQNWWDSVVAPVLKDNTTTMVLIVTAGVFDSDPNGAGNNYVWREIKYLENRRPEVLNKQLVVLIDNETISMDRALNSMPPWIEVLMLKSQFIFTEGDAESAIDQVCARVAKWEGLNADIDIAGLTVEGTELKKFNGGTATLKLQRMFKKIADLAFFGNTEIEQLFMQETNIDTIGQSAFCGCTRLSTVRLPSTLKRVKRYAFKDTPCAVKADGLTVVDKTLLTECTAGGDVVLPDSVICIADEAFAYNFDIKSVSGKNVRYIGENAFTGCKNLEKKEFPSVAELDKK